MGARIISRGIGLGLAALLLNALLVALWVWFYSLAITPGHGGAFYQAYAQRVAPISAIVVGVPLLLIAGWFSARGARPLLASLVPALSYVIADAALMAAGAMWATLLALVLSYFSKAGAAFAGGWLRQRRPRRLAAPQ